MNDNFKVIKIVDDKTIVIDCGENSKAKIGDKFQIYSPGEEVIDQDTGESFGTLDTVKAVVTIVDVLPKMSICKDRNYTSRNALSGFIDKYYYTETKDKTLNVDISQITGGIGDDLTIKVGDKVRFLKNESPMDNKSN